jgi:hypothetical protein
MDKPNHACDCCQQPPCEAPVLECVSSEGSCNIDPCGYWDPDTETTYTKKVVTTTLGTQTEYVVSRNEDGGCVFTETCSGSSTETYTLTSTPQGDPPPDCSGYSAYINLAITSTWTGVWVYDEHGTISGEECSVVYSGSGTSTASNDSGSYSNSATVNADGSVEWDGGYSEPCAKAILYHSNIYGGYWECVDVTEETTYSPPLVDEETTYSDPYVGDCDVELPDYPAWPNETATPHVSGQGSSCQAVNTKTYGGFGEVIAIAQSKFKYRLKFKPPGTCYLKVWFRKTTVTHGDSTAVPPVAGSTTYDDSVIYEWNGTGNPCLTDATKPYSDDANLVYSPPTEISVPTINGYIEIRVLKYSCVKDYEPNITDSHNLQPNGFPDPDWEAAPP